MHPAYVHLSSHRMVFMSGQVYPKRTHGEMLPSFLDAHLGYKPHSSAWCWVILTGLAAVQNSLLWRRASHCSANAQNQGRDEVDNTPQMLLAP